MTTIYRHACQQCGAEEFRFHVGSHKENEAYLWVCDHCGRQTKITFTAGGTVCHQQPIDRWCYRTLALLAFRGDRTFAFIHEGCAWSQHLKDGKPDNEYFYEESTCPVNLFRVEEIYYQGEEDPHGVFDLIEEHIINGPDGRDRDEVMELLRAKAIQITSEPDFHASLQHLGDRPCPPPPATSP